MKSTGMVLCKWTTNSQNLMVALERKKRSASKEMVVLHEQFFNVLGVALNPTKDEFSFSVDRLLDFMKERLEAKRFVLQATSRIFDPLGIVRPYTIAIRILFQKLWTRGMSWVEQLPDDLRHEWQSLVRQLPQL